MDSTLVFLIAVFVKPGYQFHLKTSFHENNERKCKKLLKDPNYEDELVVGQTWRHYYSWNILYKKCLVTKFLEATPEIIDRFALEMKNLVDVQPVWEDASMLAKTGRQEMLMIHDEGPVGSYNALKNFGQMGLTMFNVQTQKLGLKLMKDDKFLVMLDCRSGLGHVMARENDTVTEKEVLSVAENMHFGKGYIGCTNFLISREFESSS